MVLPQVTPTQTSIVNILMDEIVNQLVNYLQMIEDDPEDYPPEAIAGLIRAGKLQDDPTITGINILVHPANEEWPNRLYFRGATQGFDLDNSYEIGGLVPVQWNLKRFHIDLRLFFDNELERSVAQVKAQVVLSRVLHAIHMLNSRMNTIPNDSFGEGAHLVQTQNSYLRESGGPGTFIWKGTVRVEFLTSLDASEIAFNS